MAAQDMARTPRKSLVALAVLFAVGIFNYLDRTLLSILQIPMQKELGLTDTQLGLLLGASFALVYTTCGLPIGWLADRRSRRGILSGSLLIWTSLTALTGTATNFMTLLLCRMGVAFGEASCAPVTHSLISDYFPKRRRATAVAIWAASLPIGIVLGFLLGGWLSENLGWRRAFLDVGLVGLLLVPIAFFGLYDPRRGAFDDAAHQATARFPMSQVLRRMWQTRSYRLILIAASLHLFTFHAASVWVPQFYARNYDLAIGEVGARMALISGGGGLLGMILGGYLVDRLAERDKRWYVYLPAIAAFLLLPLTGAQYWISSLTLSVTLGVINGALFQLFFAPMIAVTQSLMPPQIRTFTGAFYVFFVNVLSMSLGPVVTGLLSDLFGADPKVGVDGLRLAMTLANVGSALSIIFFIAAAKTLREDLAKIG